MESKKQKENRLTDTENKWVTAESKRQGGGGSGLLAKGKAGAAQGSWQKARQGQLRAVGKRQGWGGSGLGKRQGGGGSGLGKRQGGGGSGLGKTCERGPRGTILQLHNK